MTTGGHSSRGRNTRAVSGSLRRAWSQYMTKNTPAYTAARKRAESSKVRPAPPSSPRRWRVYDHSCHSSEAANSAVRKAKAVMYTAPSGGMSQHRARSKNISPTAPAMQGSHRTMRSPSVRWRNRHCTASPAPRTPHSRGPSKRRGRLSMNTRQAHHSAAAVNSRGMSER